MSSWYEPWDLTEEDLRAAEEAEAELFYQQWYEAEGPQAEEDAASAAAEHPMSRLFPATTTADQHEPLEYDLVVLPWVDPGEYAVALVAAKPVRRGR